MEDGPSTALRPTIDIQKMKDWGLGDLVNVSAVDYYAYYTAVPTTTTTNKGKPNQDPTIVPEYKVVRQIRSRRTFLRDTPSRIGLMADEARGTDQQDVRLRRVLPVRGCRQDG